MSVTAVPRNVGLATLGGEQSTTSLLRSCDDWRFASSFAAHLLRMVKDSGRSLADLTSFVQRPPQTLINGRWIARVASDELGRCGRRNAEACLGDGRLFLRPRAPSPRACLVEAATQE